MRFLMCLVLMFFEGFLDTWLYLGFFGSSKGTLGYARNLFCCAIRVFFSSLHWKWETIALDVAPETTKWINSQVIIKPEDPWDFMLNPRIALAWISSLLPLEHSRSQEKDLQKGQRRGFKSILGLTVNYCSPLMTTFSLYSHNPSSSEEVSNSGRTSDLLQRLSTTIVSCCLWQGEILIHSPAWWYRSPLGGRKEGKGAKTRVGSGLLVGQEVSLLWEGDLEMLSGASAFCYGFLFYHLLTAAPQGLLCKGTGRSEQLALFEGYICAGCGDY